MRTKLEWVCRRLPLCAWRHIFCCRWWYSRFNHFQCHNIIVGQHFFWRNVDRTFAGNIETMSLVMTIWPWIYNLNEWTLNSRISCIAYAYIDLFSTNSNDMTSWQNSSTEMISCHFAPFFYHHSVVIQHLVSDRKLSSMSK